MPLVRLALATICGTAAVLINDGHGVGGDVVVFVLVFGAVSLTTDEAVIRMRGLIRRTNQRAALPRQTTKPRDETHDETRDDQPS